MAEYHRSQLQNFFVDFIVSLGVDVGKNLNVKKKGNPEELKKEEEDGMERDQNNQRRIVFKKLPDG